MKHLFAEVLEFGISDMSQVFASVLYASIERRLLVNSALDLQANMPRPFVPTSRSRLSDKSKVFCCS